MPVTVNGIGTHYYGKKNLETRPGVCRQCGKGVNLCSYDTRLWFVIVFIPIIPLGRKRILDQCPACRRHFVLDLHKWETTKQLEISGALEQFRSNPTPEAAIAVHQQLINFHQMAQAAEFRQMMLGKFSDNAKIHAYLGIVLTQLGKPEEAATCFSRALELRPDLPEARVGVARMHLRTQKFDEARKLLDFLVSSTFQNELALNLFVYPSRVDATLPPEFTKFAVVPSDPFTMDPAVIAANRQQWQDEWTNIVLR